MGTCSLVKIRANIEMEDEPCLLSPQSLAWLDGFAWLPRRRRGEFDEIQGSSPTVTAATTAPSIAPNQTAADPTGIFLFTHDGTIFTMLVSCQPKCSGEWLRRWRFLLAMETFSCPLSALAAAVQSDSSSADEKPNVVPDNKIIRRRSRALSSESVVQTLHCLKRKPADAFAYFKDTESIGFHHDFSTYTEIMHILSHSRQGKMLVSLFCDIVSPTGSGGPEILALMKHLRRTCASHTLSFAINCLIKAYTICHDAQVTIDMLSHLCRLGYVPSAWACNFVLKFVAQSSGSEMVVAAYEQLKCSQMTLDADSLSIITRSLFKAHKADKAFQLWVEMIELGVRPHEYSSFVIGLCDCGKYDLAYGVLQGVTKERVPIEAVAYNMAIDGLCKEMKLEVAEKVLDLKAKQGCSPDIYGYSYLIRSYCKMNNVLKALDHCEAMEFHGIKINCHIAGYLLQCFSKLGKTSEVIVYFEKFKDSGIRLDKVVYNIAMDAYCKLGNMNEAVKLLNEMMTRGLAPDRIHYTCLINGYCLKGNIRSALQVFEQMLKTNIVPDIVTYNILASWFCRTGLVKEANLLLGHMMDQGLENSVTYGVAIDGFCRAGHLSDAVVLFNEVEEKGINNIEALRTAMVRGYLHSGSTGLAYKLFLRVAQQGSLVDSFSCSKLINGLCREGNVKGASTVCSMMLEKGVVPDRISYTELIFAYCEAGDMHSAHLWFERMVQLIPPDVIAYTVMMNGYSRAGQFKEACYLFDRMTKLGIEPDAYVYAVLLNGSLKETLKREWPGLGNESRGLLLRTKHNKLWGNMQDIGVEPDVYCYTVLIDGLCKAGFLQEAQGLFDEMLQKGLKPDAYVYSALIHGYCEQGEIKKAEALLQEMVMNTKTDKLTLSDLRGKTLRFRKAQSHP
ncbi:unnamed protein product [Urochloa decumbens]|uniref:Pentatricopeptide repeat-containing protein n=1 Tax=Urochloa decumbens TaxID=240449 RepID=A0ABC8WJP6_9POAL